MSDINLLSDALKHAFIKQCVILGFQQSAKESYLEEVSRTLPHISGTVLSEIYDTAFRLGKKRERHKGSYLELAFEFTNLQQTSYTVPDFRVWLNIDELAEKLGVLEIKHSWISQSMRGECVFDPTLTSRITLNGECFQTESKKNNRLKVWYTAGCFLLAAAAVATLFLGFFALMPIIFAGVVAFLFAIAATILGTYAFSADEDEVVEDKVVLDSNYIELSTAYDEYFKELSELQVPDDLKLFLHVIDQKALCSHTFFSEWQAAFSAEPGRLGVFKDSLKREPARQSLSGEAFTALSLLQGDRHIAASNLSLIVKSGNNYAAVINVLMTLKSTGLLSESNVGKLMAYDITDLKCALNRLQEGRDQSLLVTSPLREDIFNALMTADASTEGAVISAALYISMLIDLPSFGELNVARQKAFIIDVTKENSETYIILRALSDNGLLSDAACVAVSAIESERKQRLFVSLLVSIKQKFDVSADEVLGCSEAMQPYLANRSDTSSLAAMIGRASTFEEFKAALSPNVEEVEAHQEETSSSWGWW